MGRKGVEVSEEVGKGKEGKREGGGVWRESRREKERFGGEREREAGERDRGILGRGGGGGGERWEMDKE